MGFAEPLGVITFSSRMLLGSSQGMFGAIGRIATTRSWSGLIWTLSFQPTSLRIRWHNCSVPVDPVDHLEVIHVDMHDMRVDTVVRDLPDLGPVSLRDPMRVPGTVFAKTSVSGSLLKYPIPCSRVWFGTAGTSTPNCAVILPNSGSKPSMTDFGITFSVIGDA